MQIKNLLPLRETYWVHLCVYLLNRNTSRLDNDYTIIMILMAF
nr:MAG TPA: hypothetical protein [Caudoviricetes sp.]